MTNEQKLTNYIKAINEIAKSQIAMYKSESLMNNHPLYDAYASKIDALEHFVNETKLSNWADGLSRLTDEV